MTEDSGVQAPTQPYAQPPYPQPPYGQHYAPQPPAPARKKRRMFLWFFLAVQALFLIWIISGIAGASGDPSDCGSLSKEACNDAEAVGTGIGVFLVVVLWMVVDFLLGVGYAIYRLARRP